MSAPFAPSISCRRVRSCAPLSRSRRNSRKNWRHCWKGEFFQRGFLQRAISASDELGVLPPPRAGRGGEGVIEALYPGPAPPPVPPPRGGGGGPWGPTPGRASAPPPQQKKAVQQGRRFGFAEAAIDFRPMQASRRREVAHAVLDCATLWVGGAVIEAPNTGERDRRRAHGAGLERDIEIALGKPLAAQRLRRP